MDHFWKWLMRMDARGIFVISLLLFLLVAGWRGWVAFRPAPPAKPAPAANGEMPPLPPFRSLGLIDYVSSQFLDQTLVVPVNPFRPTFEAMISQQASEAIRNLQAGIEPDGTRGNPPIRIRQRRPGGTNRPPVRAQTVVTATAPSPPPPPPTLTYRGMFQRPDGTIAAFLHDSARGGGRFVAVGDTLYGAAVAAVYKGGITLWLSDGSTRTLAEGDAVTLPGGGAP
jgi:hypothetical protein